MKTFRSGPPGVSGAHANADLARDFLRLSFEMESSKPIPRLTKFKGPVTVALVQPGPAQFRSDLIDLLARVRAEAGIDIRLAKTGTKANINIITLPRKTLRAAVPKAACFVVPRVNSWQEFRKGRRTGALDWTTLDFREHAAVFIPDDISPQEARDCLHEEITQALGPLNDVYRLPDSIYNDDNINAVLTKFDMLILKTYYDPALTNGMSKEQVAAALPGILKRLHPAGENIARDGIQEADGKWKKTLEAALAPHISGARRLLNGRKAVVIASDHHWNDNRLGFSLFVAGRLALGRDSKTAVESFARAFSVYNSLYGMDDIHTAHVALQIAAFALSTGHIQDAIDLVNKSLPSVARAQNAALLSALLMIKAEALDTLGHHSDAAVVRTDGIAWGRYGYASVDEIRARLIETAALRPLKTKPSS